MRIKLTSVFVDDQKKAHKFYSEVLGFVKKTELPAGDFKWLTVVSEGREDLELLLEPNVNPAASEYQKGIYAAGISATLFFVDDIEEEHKRLVQLGVSFKYDTHPIRPQPQYLLHFLSVEFFTKS